MAMNLTSAIDPNIAALIGSGGPNSAFTDLLMRSINPGALSNAQQALGSPDLGPLSRLAGSGPQIKRGYSQPKLAGPQMLQSLGFGMAAAAGKPGSSALSALGEGGTQMIAEGGNAAQRSIQEANATNQAELEKFRTRAGISEKVLDAQLKGPELGVRMADLLGQTYAREGQREDTRAYNAARIADLGAQRQIQKQNADTNVVKAGTGQQRADIYGDKAAADIDRDKKKLEQQDAYLEQRADQFESKMRLWGKQNGIKNSLEAASSAALEFRDRMRERKNPITGELPNDAIQEAIFNQIKMKYMGLAEGGGGEEAADDAAVEAAPEDDAADTAMESKPYKAQMPDGRMIYSDDGVNWTDAGGKAVR